jgi:hypothetical protein
LEHCGRNILWPECTKLAQLLYFCPATRFFLMSRGGAEHASPKNPRADCALSAYTSSSVEPHMATLSKQPSAWPRRVTRSANNPPAPLWGEGVLDNCLPTSLKWFLMGYAAPVEGPSKTDPKFDSFLGPPIFDGFWKKGTILGPPGSPNENPGDPKNPFRGKKPSARDVFVSISVVKRKKPQKRGNRRFTCMGAPL